VSYLTDKMSNLGGKIGAEKGVSGSKMWLGVFVLSMYSGTEGEEGQ